MNDRDCESCKKFSRNAPTDYVGYCEAKRTYVAPEEDGKECKMHEFTLHSATKYKDGTPIMSEPERVYCDTDCTLIHGDAENMSNQLDALEQRVDEFTEEYDTVLATHAGKINAHTDALLDHEHKLSTLSEDVSINEGSIENLDFRLEEVERKINSILKLLIHYDITPYSHVGSNFCGNCTHCNRGKQGDDTVYVCELSYEIIDPDDSSCSMFEPPF